MRTADAEGYRPFLLLVSLVARNQTGLTRFEAKYGTIGPMIFQFDNSFAKELAGFYAACEPDTIAQAELAYFNEGLSRQLGMPELEDVSYLARLFSGSELPTGAEPIAQAYAGHQFGHFSPQLGDGRAHLLGEVVDSSGQRLDISFKGSGRTPFSRGGDGKAAIGPMLREVLISEAMHALGVSTTRSLAVVATGETVYRDRPLPGAILTRVASSHIRIGTFQYFAAKGEVDKVRRLADYTIQRHYADLQETEQPYLELLGAVCQRQAALLAQWMGLGFIHGVMNTDNMSIAGETIDYGPCAFMEAYDPQAVFSSIDEQGRYAYQNQPGIAQWNLARFAETLLPLLADSETQSIEAATGIIQSFPDAYQQHWLQIMRGKLGLTQQAELADEEDLVLVLQWLHLLETQQVDFTLAWRYLGDAAAGDRSRFDQLFADQSMLNEWLMQYQQRSEKEYAEADRTQQAEAMRQVNPIYIPRNHLVEEALAAASDKGDLRPFKQLMAVLQDPYTEQAAYEQYAQPASAKFMAEFKTFCGT